MHYKYFLLVLISLLLVCGIIGKFTAIGKDRLHAEYLACYALDEIAKKECTGQLAVKYFGKEWQQDKEHIQAFQFKSEKLGFKQFLNNLDLPCESINDGPEFITTEKAYLVKCLPTGHYFMRFNYESKEWQLIKDKTMIDRKSY